MNYNAIGDGIRFAQSGPQRLMLAGQTPIWIVAAYTDSFTDIIDRIRPFIEHSTASNIEKAFELLDQAAFVTGCAHEYIVLGQDVPNDVANILSASHYLEMDL